MFTISKRIPLTTVLLAAAFALVFLNFLWQGRTGLSLWDEGYLWYGAQRVMLGEVPIRDFMAYDPGRYYWAASIMTIMHDNGIVALRFSVALFQALGLFVGLVLLVRGEERPHWVFIALCAVTLLAWMVPRHKLFDISISIFLIGLLAWLIRKPSGRRYFLTGIGVGLVAVFGRNHGVYGAVASVIAIFWLQIQAGQRRRLGPGLLTWGAGVVAGYLPMLIMLLVVPGMWPAFIKSILFYREIKGTNLPLPVPWPWDVNFSTLPAHSALLGVIVGAGFVGVLLFGLAAPTWVMVQKYRQKPVSPEFAAASFLALPYAHFAFSRADEGHLAQGIFPLLIGCMILLATQAPRIKWPSILLVFLASIFVTLPFQSAWQCRAGSQCRDLVVDHDTLLVDPGTAQDIDLLRQLDEKCGRKGSTFIAEPFSPGAYAALGRKAPVWEIYATVPRSPAFQEAEITRIKQSKPSFAMITQFALDGREELRFKNTHALLYAYILRNFRPVKIDANSGYETYCAKVEH